MSYAHVAQIHQDYPLRQRITACAATENIDGPEQWVSENIWKLAAQPGWATAWASALAAEVSEPGSNESVISDSMILAAVQSLTQS